MVNDKVSFFISPIEIVSISWKIKKKATKQMKSNRCIYTEKSSFNPYKRNYALNHASAMLRFLDERKKPILIQSSSCSFFSLALCANTKPDVCVNERKPKSNLKSITELIALKNRTGYLTWLIHVIVVIHLKQTLNDEKPNWLMIGNYVDFKRHPIN